MSVLGVRQCKSLTLSLCKLSGSSRGARAFEELFATDFQQDNPDLEFNVVHRPSKHPFLEALYRNGRQRVVGVKNQSEEDILRVAYLLRSTKGKKPSLPLPRHQTPLVECINKGSPTRASSSVQGKWFPGLFPPAQSR